MHQRDTKLTPDYQEFDTLMPGDVVRWGPRRTLRKVRSVRYDEADRLKSVTFAILHRSWTNRPYTVYFRTDLKGMFHGVVGSASLCSTREECLTQKEIESEENKHFIYAHDMVGKVY